METPSYLEPSICQCGHEYSDHIIDIEDPWRALLEVAEYIAAKEPMREVLGQLTRDCREIAPVRCIGNRTCSCTEFREADDAYYEMLRQDAELERAGL